MLRTVVRLALCLFYASTVFAAFSSVADAQDEDTRERALVYFRGARDAYEAGEFQRSVVLLEEALELHDVASLHYNLGRALHELGRWRDARAEYVKFLDMDPDTEERARVEARIVVLTETIEREELAEQRQAPAPEPPGETSTSEGAAPREVQAAPWILLSVGVAAFGAGAVSGVLSRRSLDEVRGAPDHRSALSVGETARRRATLANVLFVSGAVVSATGLIWGLVSRRRPRVEVDVGLTSIGLRGRF